MGVVILVVAMLSVAASLVFRAIHRGPYYPGWDVVGAAQGLHLVTTETPRAIFKWYVDNHYNPTIGWNTYGAPHVLLPGWLTSVWPWEYWPHVLTLVFTLASFALVGAAVRLRGLEWGILPLAWGASSTLLSWSICGFAYSSAAWPYAVALWIVLRLAERPLATLLLIPPTIEFAWQVQDLGRTVFVVFLAAAFLVRPARWATRILWLVAGTWQLWDSWRHPTFNTARYSHIGFTSDAGTRLLELGSRVFVEHQLDLPVLFVVGIVSVLLVRNHRWFWRSLLAIQVGLVVLLALNTGILQGVGAVWPRRFLLVEFVCLAATAALYRELGARPAAVLVGLLLAGNVWQLADTWRWSRVPIAQQVKTWIFPMPYTQTTLDYMLSLGAIEFAGEVRQQVDRGNKVIVVYNITSYEENATNPAGVPERLYVALGHHRFMESVFMFGSQNLRWNTFPIRPLNELEPFVRGITDPTRFVGYLRMHPMDHPIFRQDVATITASLARRWALAWEPLSPRPNDAARVARFRLGAPQE